jgi:hypothetical protein
MTAIDLLIIYPVKGSIGISGGKWLKGSQRECPTQVSN